MLPLMEKEIMQQTKTLEEAIECQDWYAYQSLCDINTEMGLHKLLFDFNETPLITPSSRSHGRSPIPLVHSPIVAITGTTAKISYSNHVTVTRDWQLKNGQWKMTRYHKYITL